MPEDRKPDEGRPNIGSRHEALESLRKAPLDDARNLFNVYLRLAFCEGQLKGRDEECECCEKIVRATCCCRRCREREEEWEDRDDDDRGDRDRGDRDRGDRDRDRERR